MRKQIEMWLLSYWDIKLLKINRNGKNHTDISGSCMLEGL